MGDGDGGHLVALGSETFGESALFSSYSSYERPMGEGVKKLAPSVSVM